MITINLRLVGGINKLLKVNKDVIRIAEGATVSDLVEEIWGQRVTTDCQVPFLIIVNGASIHYLNKYETVLKDGDTVSFLPYLAGG